MDTAEERELEFDLTMDASSFGYTDQAHDIAVGAAEAALTRWENGQRSALLLTTERAAQIAVTAALRALDEAGHLLPEGATVTRSWRIRNILGSHDTRLLDAAELEEYMHEVGLEDGEEVDVIRTIVTPIPREATRPAQITEPVTEANF